MTKEPLHGSGSFCVREQGYLRRVLFFRPVDFLAVVFFFVVLRPVACLVVFFVVFRPVVLRAVVFLRPVVFLVVFRPVVLRAVVFFVVFFRPPRPVPLDAAAAGLGAAGGGVPGNGAGQLDAGSCCEPDQVSPRLPCSTK